jgi:hypothetical protein
MIIGRNRLLIFLLVLVVSSCATSMTPEQISQKVSAINYTDGVDEDEAILLAQKFMIDKGLAETHSIYNLEEVLLDESGSFWTVNFGGSIARGASQTRQFGFTPSLSVKVNSKDGKAELGE